MGLFGHESMFTSFAPDGSFNELPDPQKDKLKDVWAVDFYVITVEICCGFMIFVYTFTFWRVCRGSAYPFILGLVSLLFFSNIGAGISTYATSKVADLVTVPKS